MGNDNARPTAFRQITPLALCLMVLMCLPSARAQAPATQPTAVEPAAPPAPQTQPTQDATVIRQWFEDLAHADPAVRSDAAMRLMGLGVDDLPTLKKLILQNPTLEPAQATALREIVMHVVMAGEDYHGDPAIGFLGVRMEPLIVGFHDIETGAGAVERPGIVITYRIPGFIGARMLQDGDVVLAIRDRPDTPLTDGDSFSLTIRQIKAGTIVHFQVLRQGEVIDVPIKLDARPSEADGNFGINDMVAARLHHAEDYWNQHFAPIVREGVSMRHPPARPVA